MTGQELLELFRALPDPAPVSFRLYHDHQGNLLFYSMEDLPGNYVEISAEMFALSPSLVRVKNGTVVAIPWAVPTKLVPANTGTACDPYSVMLVVADDQPNQRWMTKQYD